MTAYVQDHIHLADSLGGGAEDSPIYKWAISQRDVQYQAFASIDYGLSGKPLVYSVTNNSGEPLVRKNSMLTIRLVDIPSGLRIMEQIDLLRTWHMKLIYYVPSYHAGDGVNHQPYTQSVYLTEIGGESWGNTVMTYAEVQITLIDAEDY